MTTPTLLLIDGSSYLYRAFHALPDLRTSQGHPSNALYGMISMVKKLTKDRPADYIACVFDAKGANFRHNLYADYKANRPAMPKDLCVQIDTIQAAIQALGWPVLIVDGVEADDVIGTLAHQASHAGIRTVIATGDKDMAQLVNANVSLINTMTNEIVDESAVIAKFGVTPQRFVDYLTLIGDSVDNVPGVPKVGPKIAQKWLAQYGDLDNVIANAEAIGGVVGNNLKASLSWLPTAKQLLTICCEVDLSSFLPQGIDSLSPRQQDTACLRHIYRYYEFKTWLKELSSAPSGTADKRYATILNEEQLACWLKRFASAEIVSIDTETDHLDPLKARLVGLSFAINSGEAAYVPLAHDYAEVPAQLPLNDTLLKLKLWLENPQCRKVGQHLKYDQHVLANHDIRLRGISDDTLLASYVLDSTEAHNMDDMASKHLGITTIRYQDVVGRGAKQIPFNAVALDRATDYAAQDADVTLQLHHYFRPRLAANDALEYVYRHIELPVREVLFHMERHGVLLDINHLDKQNHQLFLALNALQLRAHHLADKEFNLNSPKQIAEILEALDLPLRKKTPKGALSTDEEVLAELAQNYPLPRCLLEHRSLAKLRSTYTNKLPHMVNPQTGRIHTRYTQTAAITGRLASSHPNLQNIPIRTSEGRRIREAFIAPQGYYLVSADYSQIELRIMAHLSGDSCLLSAFASGVDIHKSTAAEIFCLPLAEISHEQRRYAKAINFGLIYGMSAFGLAAQLGIERHAAQQYIDRYFERYPGVAAYIERLRQQARQQGYVQTLLGRRLWLKDIQSSSSTRRAAAERTAINAPMQGTAADLIKLAMIKVYQWIKQNKSQSRLIMQVHDELILEVPDAELTIVREQLPQLMAGVAELKVPLLAEMGYGFNWEMAH